MKSDFDENLINRICAGIDNDNLKKELNRCDSKDMVERYIPNVNYLNEAEYLYLLFCGGIELSSVNLIEILTNKIRKNPPLATEIAEKIIALNDKNPAMSISDGDLVLAVGELYETIQMFKTDTSEICEQTRKIYSKLKKSRKLPFFFKVKKIGSKVYYFAAHEKNDLKLELENLLKESEIKGTKEDISHCHFYLGLFLYKQDDSDKYDIRSHFVKANGTCPFASAPYVTDFIEKCSEQYDSAFFAINNYRNYVGDDDYDDDYDDRFKYGGFDDDDEDNYEDNYDDDYDD